MKLLLMRHGEASFDARNDFERVLTPRGRDVVQSRAGQIAQCTGKPARLLVSPYVRTQQTASIVTSVLGEVTSITLEELTPDVSVTTAIAAMREHFSEHEATEQVVMVVTHQPLVSKMVEYLTLQASPMQPGDVVMIELPAIVAGFGELVCEF